MCTKFKTRVPVTEKKVMNYSKMYKLKGKQVSRIKGAEEEHLH
jgi:hypothetical protein